MVSILIPVYNQKVTKLVTDLHIQCTKAKITFEIVLFDDKSTDKYRDDNRKLAGLFNVSYLEMSENMGRARIRNLLAKNARYEKLLFLDSDSKLISKKFIKKYIEVINDHDIIYGGRVYPKKAPTAKGKQLHWKYGKKREALPASKRLKKPYMRFQSNNFIIDRELFLAYKFDPTLMRYGYEDLVLATKLKQGGHHIHHIENPIKHKGIEKSDVFLTKQEKAIQNLIYLKEKDSIMDTRLWKSYLKLKYNGLLSSFKLLYPNFENRIQASLHSVKPNLYYLDLWKLHYLIEILEPKKA